MVCEVWSVLFFLGGGGGGVGAGVHEGALAEGDRVVRRHVRGGVGGAVLLPEQTYAQGSSNANATTARTDVVP